MKRSLKVTSILSILVVLICLAMTPLTASAATAETPYGGSETIPAFFGGELHGTKTSSVEVEGQGTLSATVNYDSGEVSYTDFNGIQKTMSLAQLTNMAAKSIEKMPEAQQQQLLQQAQEPVTYGYRSNVCSLLVTYIGLIHDGAWAAALALVGANPALAAVVALGGSTFWWWISQHC